MRFADCPVKKRLDCGADFPARTGVPVEYWQVSDPPSILSGGSRDQILQEYRAIQTEPPSTSATGSLFRPRKRFLKWHSAMRIIPGMKRGGHPRAAKTGMVSEGRIW